jgi:hypothetical protein
LKSNAVSLDNGQLKRAEGVLRDQIVQFRGAVTGYRARTCTAAPQTWRTAARWTGSGSATRFAEEGCWEMDCRAHIAGANSQLDAYRTGGNPNVAEEPHERSR